jgi:hypothetical protein
MTSEKLKSLFAGYRIFLEHHPTLSVMRASEQLSQAQAGLHVGMLGRAAVVAHLKFMCEEAARHVDAGRVDKAMRWLGFLQGVLWKSDLCTLDDLKNHSRPDGTGVAVPGPTGKDAG